MAELCNACLQGDFARARDLQRRYHALMEVNFVESSPGPVKAALAMMGRIEPYYRLPIVPPQPESRARIEKVLAEVGLVTPVAASAH
jgi:4-hydroxy-tetrahydrodipicolinate synthase